MILTNVGVFPEKPFQIENQYGFWAEKTGVRQNSLLQENRVKGGVPVLAKSSLY